MDIIKHIEKLGDISAIYLTCKDITTLAIVPTNKIDMAIDEKIACNLYPMYGHSAPMPLIDVALRGDGFTRNFCSGDYMHNSDTAMSLRFVKQDVIKENNKTKILTYLKNERIEAIHTLVWNEIDKYIEVYNEVTNISNEKIIVEALPSFTIGGLSPFMKDNDTDHLKIYEVVNDWSTEGRIRCQTASELNLYDSWSHYGIRGYHILQRGSMPTKKNLEFMALEDEINHIVWAVSLCEPASWQLEVIHNTNSICMSGGMVDEYNGHFSVTLNKNETYRTNKANITCVNGSFNDALIELINSQKTITCASKYEDDLPIIYNEYLINLGNPNIEKIKKLIEEAKLCNAKYFVMDAGWYIGENDSWESVGDWNVSNLRFPNGLIEFSSVVREANMIPGIWFEFESVSTTSNVYKEHPEWLLTKDNKIINHCGRCFLDFRKKEVIDYLKEKVIKLVKDNNIGYIKSDYNENIGLGVDDDNSYAYGLKKHMEAVIDFFKEIKKEVPDIILEMCSSGGMRHATPLLELGDMCSFSDAHFGDEGLPIALGLVNFIPARKLQIWVELSKEFTIDKYYFAIAKGMIGRICYSGKFSDLNNEQSKIITIGNEFYNNVKHIIKNGRVDFIVDKTTNVYQSEDKEFIYKRDYKNESILYYFIKNPSNKKNIIKINGYEVLNEFTNVKYSINNKQIVITHNKDGYNVLVLHLKKKGE